MTDAHATRIREALQTASEGLVDRESLVELIALSAVAGEHMLVIGPPGTAKSEAVRRVSKVLGGHYFEYLLGRFTEPSEIFGPVDLRKLREGVVVTATAGMLPEADIAFLDEVFLGSTAILNTLLGILNERVFRRGHTVVDCPLRVCVGASNALPDDPSLGAFADRFLVRSFVRPVSETVLEDLLEEGWKLRQPLSSDAAIGDLDALSTAARAVDVSVVRTALADALRRLRSNGVALSDRRAVKTQRLVAAAAALDGRGVATEADLWPIIYAVPTSAGQDIARDVLRDQLSASESGTLGAAALEASQGPAARAARVVEAGLAVFERRPDGDEGRSSWALQLEAVAREIDAALAPDQWTPQVRELRDRIRAELGSHSGTEAATVD